MTTVRRITVYQELSELASAWNELARGVPFRQWEWLHSWWEEFGETSELYTLTVRDDHDKLLGVAPWYIENSSTRGRVIRFLGSGSVCTDYQSLLCRREDSQTVAGAIANWLKQAGSSTVIANGNDGWDLIDLEGIDAEDATITALTESLKQTGVNVWETPGLNCWRLPLPRTIPDFVSLFGKSSKSQVKRMINRLAKSDDLQVGLVSTREELDSIWGKFVELHQRRWRSLGHPGCFHDSRFERFLRKTSERMYDSGQLQIFWLSQNEKVVAVHYHVVGDRIAYLYQSGIDPDELATSPGRLLFAHVLTHGVNNDWSAYDFLRGDESYKAWWRAEPRVSIQVHAVAAKRSAQLRYGMWSAGETLKDWMKSGMEMTGLR